MPRKSSIYYLGRSPNEVTFFINGQRYTYTMRECAVCDTVEYLAQKVSLGKAFAFARSRAIITEKHT